MQEEAVKRVMEMQRRSRSYTQEGGMSGMGNSSETANTAGVDRLVIRALSQAKRAHPDITLMLMTPYYPVNRKVDLPEEFDALFYPPDLETVPKRLAIIRANRYMVERSDFLIAYVRHPASNARELLEYAGTGKRKGKIHITNLADEQISLPKKTDDVI